VSYAPHRYVSPLRYPGGKAQVCNFLKVLLLENDLVGSDYVEPYAGGASVALSLLFEDYVSTVHINDLNLGVHDFWHSVLYHTEELCSLISQASLTVNEWRRQRDIAASDDVSSIERGFATFYLNRTNRSGIISGGIIGGLDQTGRWKMDARFPRDELVRRIRKVARFRSRVTLTRYDSLQLLRETASSDAENRFYFLDPPYYSKGERLYDNFYDHDDHQKIHNAVAEMKDPWVVFYDAASEIMSMYSEYASLRYSLSYSANAHGQGEEVMFSAPGLVLPGRPPSEVSSRHVSDVRLGAVMLPFA
jgi:DNA adenine methylase